jgi:repressor of nif and glnA expression
MESTTNLQKRRLKSMKQKLEVIADWIERINTEGRKLTEWELEFMESIAEQFDRIGSLSDRQEEILERIYAEKTV